MKTTKAFFVVLGIALSAAPGLAQTTPHGSVFSKFYESIAQNRTGNPVKSVDGQDDATTTPSAQDFYVEQLDSIVQGRCVVCHQSGGAAANWSPPARILFSRNATTNHQALSTFLTTEGVGADWLLDKIVGDAGHGGAAVLTYGSQEYQVFEEYTDLVFGVDTSSAGSSVDFWDGTAYESRETTLRRAAFLLSGTVPNKNAISRAKQSEEGLRQEILKLMTGEGFHQFLINGANDRLLTNGLDAGIDFQFDFRGRFPAFAEFSRGLPEELPEEFDTEEYWNKPFLTQNEADREFRRAAIREPIELIAYIVENNRSYKEVVTANYTMVNAFSNIGYRSGLDFSMDFVDANGFYDRRQLNEFLPGQNNGHIPFDNETWHGEDGWIESFSGYHEWPHAGVLSMPAWLSRYPSTDTNRNRARSRWTYYHFLDVDIEKSAPRSTDPAALADTNNPTMNNPACTVCHVRMDPVAGAYQSFGDQGHYLDQHGGMDSLPGTYKYPEPPSGEPHILERDLSLVKHDYQFFTEYFVVEGGGVGTFLVADISPRSCVQDEENSTEDRWEGWCASMGIDYIIVRQDGRFVERIDAENFESDDRFSVDTWTDHETGEVYPRGDLQTQNQDIAYFGHPNSWIGFDFDFGAGNYQIEVNLVTQMDEGHPENTMTAGFSWIPGGLSQTTYQYGDTWYRDMRTPGFEGAEVSGNTDSIQWLGQKIANDPRFAAAAVKFWWPAIFGEPALSAPEDPSLPDYEAQLLAYNEQQAVIAGLAAGFEEKYFRAKQLFADMVMSPWFRTSQVTDPDMTYTQQVALESVGSGRLLTPEELDRKNRAVFGRTWGQHYNDHQAHQYYEETNLTRRWGGYSTFYGGIDSATVTVRNRDMTSLMSNVTEKMATDLACQVVLEDFSRESSSRLLFSSVEKDTDPDVLERSVHVLEHDPSLAQDYEQVHQQRYSFETGGQGVAVRFSDPTPNGCTYSEELERGWCSHVGVAKVVIHQNGRAVKVFEGGEQIQNFAGFSSDQYYDDQEGQYHPRGWVHHFRNKTAWVGHTNSWFELELDLPAGEYGVTVDWVYWFNEGHPENTVVTELAIKTVEPDPTTEGSQRITQQINDLVLRATGREPSSAEVAAIKSAFSAAARQAQQEGNHFFSNADCDTWSLWPNEQLTHTEWEQKYRDSDGVMRAWTMVLRSIMTSYEYLHD